MPPTPSTRSSFHFPRTVVPMRRSTISLSVLTTASLADAMVPVVFLAVAARLEAAAGRAEAGRLLAGAQVVEEGSAGGSAGEEVVAIGVGVAATDLPLGPAFTLGSSVADGLAARAATAGHGDTGRGDEQGGGEKKLPGVHVRAQGSPPRRRGRRFYLN